MSNISKYLNAKSKLDSMYSKLDEKCGFKEPTKKEIREQQKKLNQIPNNPEFCNTCSYRKSRCWVGYERSGTCKNNYCRVYKED